MFNIIPGNEVYKINLAKQIVNKDGQECTLVVNDNKVRIELYGVVKEVDLTWLSLIAHYEVNLPKNLEHMLTHIEFQDIDSRILKIRCSKIMRFKKPINLTMEYRVIPNYTNYAISKDGKVLDISNGTYVPFSAKSNWYPVVHIYDPDRKESRHVLLHRLVALAWRMHNNFTERPYVNHIDGNKQHYHYRNLEWCSASENNYHAINEGLRPDNYPCKVFDAVTKTEYLFSSLAQANEFMGYDEIIVRNLNPKRRDKLINERYQIKSQDDPSPWFYQDRDIGEKAGRYSLFVTDEEGVVSEYPDVRTFKKLFKVWNVSSIEDLVTKFKQLYPTKSIAYNDHYNIRPIQAYKLSDGVIIESDSIRELSRTLNMDYSSIYSILNNRSETSVYKGYAFRYKTDKAWDTNFIENTYEPVCILATNIETKQKLNFKSLREAAKHFDVDRCVIKRCIEKELVLKSYILK